MRCSKVQFLYEEYVSGTLDPERATRVDAHLAMCESCRSAFEENDDLSELISDSCEVVHPGAEYLEALTRRVAESLYDETGEFLPARAAGSGARKVIPVPVVRRPVQPLWWAGALAATLLVVPMVGSALLNRPEAGEGGVERPVAVAAAADEAIAGDPESEALAGPETGIGAGEEFGEEFIGRTIAKSVRESGEADLGIPAAGPDSAAIQTVSVFPPRFQRGVERAAAGDAELTSLEELVALEAVATPEARQRIFQLLRELGDRMAQEAPGQLQPGLLTGEHLLAAQTSHYHRAESAAERGDVREAVGQYEQVLELNPTTILGRRSAMRVADLYYYELGVFAQALSRYSLCASQSVNFALTPEELEHVESRLELLRRYEGEEWAPLREVHEFGRVEWAALPAAVSGLDRFASDAQLWEETVEAVARRLMRSDLPGDEVAFELIEVVETRLASEQNAEIQGWLRVLMGDLIWVQFEGQEPAIEAYEHAVEVAEQTPAGRAAQQRLASLRDQSFAVFSSR